MKFHCQMKMKHRCYVFISVLSFGVFCVMYILLISTPRDFGPRMNTREYTILLNVVNAFDRAMTSANLSYFLVRGSLLGSYRHHGFIPWDDDFDVCANVSEKELIKDALSLLEPNYKLHTTPSPHLWRFYSANATVYPDSTYGWPTLDIFFFSYNSERLWYDNKFFKGELDVPIKNVFPVRRRPFSGLSLPVPCNQSSALAYYEDLMKSCVANEFYYRHTRNIFKLVSPSLPCSMLQHAYPFVERTKLKQGWQETLTFRTKVLQSYIFEDYC